MTRPSNAAEFLRNALAKGLLPVTVIEAKARAAGLLGERQQIGHAKTFRKAKAFLGIRSVRAGFGAGGTWSWVLPAKPAQRPKKKVERTENANCSGQTHSALVDLNGLPAELLRTRIPSHWIYGIARLDSTQAPRDVPAHRWRQFVNDCHRFLTAKENWAERAAALGWKDLQLFGCCPRPLERLECAGLLWAISGGKLIELHRDWAVIERARDRSPQVHHRERPRAMSIALPWVGPLARSILQRSQFLGKES
jgi:hypothetical protein